MHAKGWGFRNKKILDFKEHNLLGEKERKQQTQCSGAKYKSWYKS